LIYGSRPENCSAFNGQGRGLLDDISEDEGFSVRAESLKTNLDESLNSLKVLDMKKTAEIEAMFTAMKVDDNLKCANEELTRHRRFINSGKVVGHPNTSVDFHTSLGYLP